MIKGSPFVGGPFVIIARGVELRVIPERFRRAAAGASGDIRAHEVPLAALQPPSPSSIQTGTVRGMIILSVPLYVDRISPKQDKRTVPVSDPVSGQAHIWQAMRSYKGNERFFVHKNLDCDA